MKFKIMVLLLIVAMSFAVSPAVYAATDTATQTVNITVSDELSITTLDTVIDLSFAGWTAGSWSNSQLANYTIAANNLAQADGAPVVTAQLDSDFTGVTFMGEVGTWVPDGTDPGDTTLEKVSGDVTIASASAATLATKGSGGKIAKGVLPVTYKAQIGASPLSGDYSESKTLTVTLTNV